MAMTRSVLVSAGGDPLLTMLVYKLFKRYWYEEVDKMYICFNTEMKRDFLPELFTKLSKDNKVSIIYHPFAIGYGEPIRQMVQCSREDLVLLLEDDGFIFTPSVVDNYFKGIENDEYDLAGSPRRSCTQEIWDRSKEIWNLNYEGMGDKGPTFWPNFLYCKRADLLKTDQNFAPKSYEAGTYCKPLDYTFQELNTGDTFVWTSLQLRALGLRIKEIPQFHASPTEVKDRDEKIGNWIDGTKPTYLHGGSLSSGWSWNGFLLGRQPIGSPSEIETRVAFWKIASDTVEGFDDFKIEYRKGIQELTNQLDESNIRVKYNVYRDLMGI